MIMAVLVAGLACVKDRPCRDNTVLVNVEFADSHDRVDGVVLKHRLDDGPAVGLNPIERPPGVDQDGLQLTVQDYSSHKKLTLEYAPSKAGNVVGPWQEEVVELKPGCTTVDLIVAIGGRDAGLANAPTVDALLAIDAPADGMVAEVGVDGALPRDVAPEVLVAMPEAGVVDALVQPEVPLAREGDASLESAALVDLAVGVIAVDAPLAQDLPLGTASDATPDGSREVSTGPDVASDRPKDVSQVGCLIDSTPYASGDANPADACQTCQPALSVSTWTNVSNGTACGSEQVCSVGICRLGCWLDGAYYPAAATKPGNDCQYCNPTLSVSTWTNEEDGMSCGSGHVCNAGLCGTGCWVNGTLYTSGAVNPANACQTCQPGISDTAWSDTAKGASCGAGQVCSFAGCQSGCWIDGSLYSSGAAKPGNPCQTCQPAVSVTAWADSASTTACPAGQVCAGGVCQPGCWIGGTYYASGVANPSNTCQACRPDVAVALWTNTTCGTGGTPATGGAGGAGGTTATGGATSAGGVNGTGGTTSTGGSSANGAGGSATGGTTNCEYDVPTASSKVTSLDVDASGNVWFVENGGQKIGKFNPQTQKFSEYPAAISPGYIHFNPVDSMLYILGGTYGSGLFGTVDPISGTVSTFPSGLPVSSTAFGLVRSDGSFWFNGWDSQSVSHGTKTGPVTNYIPPHFGYMSGLTEDSSGNLWLTIVNAYEGNPRLLKLDLSAAVANTSSGFTEISLYSQASTVRDPRAVGNRVWFMVQDRSSIAYYDVTTSTVTTISTPTANAGVSGMELDANGNPWFAEPTANNIAFFDTATGLVHEYPIKTASAGAYALAIDRTRGIVWYSEQTANKIGCRSLTP